jgi:ABC-type branched-subunit amino acid transport system substrate-binding protein
MRHRIALLVPVSGTNAAVGQALANGASMALLDTNATDLRITTYDTGADPAQAATRAIADGNTLILGPLLGDDVAAVAKIASPAKVPIISFSNDLSVAGHDVFIMGSLPSDSIARTVSYAHSQGAKRFAALLPDGEYGARAADAFATSVKAVGGTVIATLPYARGNTSIISAAQRLKAKGGFDAVLIADGGRFAILAAPHLRAVGTLSPRLLGTELWNGDTATATSPALRGSWYSALSNARFTRFTESYKSRFGIAPYRIATLGYDAVLLTLRVSKDWKPGSLFPTERLYDPQGFLGVDGPLRFASTGVVERTFDVIELRAGGTSVVSPAPTGFGK